MRRTDKEIKDPEIISRIISMCQVCRLGLAKDNIPYIVPVSFGYDGSALYIHTATTGRKIEFFEANPNICIEFEHDVHVKAHESMPCNWSFSYQSVISYGVIRELSEPTEIIAALKLIMRTYSEKDWSFSEADIASIRVWKISIDSLTGKNSKRKID